MDKTFIFDLDDTLIPNHHYYSHAQLDFVRWVMGKVGHKGPDAHYILNLQVDIDYNSVKLDGFGMDRFPSSFAETYKQICNQMTKPCPEEDIEEAKEIGRRAFDQKNYENDGMFPGTKKTLDFLLEQGDKLILITKGDPKIQEPKIRINNLARWFGQDIHTVPTKNTVIFQDILRDRAPETAWSVGNSYGSDISPALELGMGGIYIPCETWKFERDQKPKKIPTNPKLLTFKKIIEIKQNYQSL